MLQWWWYKQRIRDWHFKILLKSLKKAKKRLFGVATEAVSSCCVLTSLFW